MSTYWILFSGVYSALFTYLISEFFHGRRENKLRAEHREQLDLLRSQYRGDVEPNGRFTVMPLSASPQFRAASEQGHLKGKVQGMSENLDNLMRRVAKLEANQGDDQRGAA